MEAASLDTSVCSTLNGHGTIGLKVGLDYQTGGMKAGFGKLVTRQLE